MDAEWKGAVRVQKTICPHCEQPSYSSMTDTQVWECPYCGKPFLAVEGETRGRHIEPPERQSDGAAHRR